MQVSNVSAPVMEIVLEFIYTNLMPALPEAFLTEEGAEELFYAADRYLIFPMKVRASRLPHPAAHFQPSLSPHGGTCGLHACQWPRASRMEVFWCAQENQRAGLQGPGRVQAPLEAFWCISVQYGHLACICNRAMHSL